MKKILYIIVATILFVACSKGEQDFRGGETGTLAVNVQGFPAYDDTPTRAVGTADAGKTAWVNGDKVILKLQLKKSGINQGSPLYYSLTYNGTTWTPNNPLPQVLYGDRSITVDYTAYYTPAYQWTLSSGFMYLSDGKIAGADEYLVKTTTGAVLVDGININFSGMRNYSRLRIAASAANASVKLSCANFIPVNTILPLGTNVVTLTADAKGNAYFYGTWAAATEMEVQNLSGVKFFSKTGIAASVNGRSYVADATAEKVIRTFNITFNLNGGSGTPPAAIPVTEGFTAILPLCGEMIPQSGKMFGGWALTTSGAAVASPYSPTADVPLYARWVTDNDVLAAETGNSAPRIYVDPNAGNPILRLTKRPANLGTLLQFGSVLAWNYGNEGTPDFNPSNLPGTWDGTWSSPVTSTYCADTPTATQVANMKNGIGDPCRLVGYTQSDIKAKLAAGQLPDNGKWRLPTKAECEAMYINAEGYWKAAEKGYHYPLSPDGAFMPANGRRTSDGRSIWVGTDGGYFGSHSSTGCVNHSFTRSYNLVTSNSYESSSIHIFGLGIRCVRQ